MGAASYSGSLTSHTGTEWRKTRKYIKRQTARRARRLGKTMGMNAPMRVTKGWSD